ncbi:MAG: DegT/DnrJ/EryC1/StrS family aminotransferase [Thermodesulfobacteriota bacterium]
MKREDFVVFGKPRIEEEEIAEVVDSLRSGWLSTGPKVARFEEMFRQYVGCRYAVALNSCTAGLHLLLLAGGIGPEDEVITTPLTFAATANVIVHVGAKPVFVDVDSATMNIDAQQVESALQAGAGRVKALIVVHLAGRPCAMRPLWKLAEGWGLMLFEDAAHATEAWYQGKKVGTLGDGAAFSFYVTKNLVTGEGGMVTTDREEWADKIRILSLHGMTKGAWRRYSETGHAHYQILYPGFKYNMMDVQAALGIHQLPRLGSYLERREEIWRAYDQAFQDLPVRLPPPAGEGIVHARHLYTPLLDLDRLTVDRDAVIEELREEGIGTGIHFISLHLQPYYQQVHGYKEGQFPVAEEISRRTISLPLSAQLSDGEVERVIEAFRKVLLRHARE